MFNMFLLLKVISFLQVKKPLAAVFAMKHFYIEGKEMLIKIIAHINYKLFEFSILVGCLLIDVLKYL